MLGNSYRRGRFAFDCELSISFIRLFDGVLGSTPEVCWFVFMSSGVLFCCSLLMGVLDVEKFGSL